MPKQKGATMTASSLRNLRKGRGQPEAKANPLLQPKVTPAAADQFVRLQAAGLPPLDALAFLHKDYFSRLSKTQKQTFLSDWLTNPLVATAWDAFNGGSWADLDQNDRFQLALDVHSAQCAYFLFTSDFTDPSAPIGKIAEARTVLMKRLELDSGNADVYAKFLKDIVAQSVAGGPSVMGAVPAVPTVPVSEPEQEM